MSEAPTAQHVKIEDVLEETEKKLGNDFTDRNLLIPREDIEEAIVSLGLGLDLKRWVERLIDLGRTTKSEPRRGITLREFRLDRTPIIGTKEDYDCEISFEIGNAVAEFSLVRGKQVETNLERLDSKLEAAGQRHSTYGEIAEMIDEWKSFGRGERNNIIKALLPEFWIPESES